MTATTYFNASHPYIGLIVTNDESKPVLITEVEPGTLADKEGIEKGDIILKVDGLDPHNIEPVSKFERIEQVSNVVLQKKNGEIENISFSSKLDIQLFFQIIIPFCIAILSIFANYHIYKSNEVVEKKSSIYLMLFLLIIAIAYSSGGSAARGDLFFRYVNISTFLSVPVLFVQFLHHYFSDIGTVWFRKWFYKIGYFLVFINLVIESIQMDGFGPKKTTNLFSFLLLYILTLVVMLIGVKKVEYRAQKYLIKVLLISNVIAIAPFILFYVIPYSIFNIHIFPPVILSSFLLIIPTAVVYQFLAEKIHDIDFFIGRLRYLVIISLIPAMINIFVTFSTPVGNNLGLYSVRLFIFSLVVFMVSFYYKEILDFKLNRFSEKRNYQGSIFTYTENLRKANNIQQVIKELKRTILDITIVSDIKLVEINLPNQQINIESLESYNKVNEKYLTQIQKCQEYIGQIKEIDKGFIIYVGEATNKNFLLLCTSKINTPKLTRDEISYLKSLAYYTNVTLENFLKIENLMDHLENIETSKDNPIWLNRVLFKLEEKQRSEVAKDLHDSVLQDLLSFQKRLENSKEKYEYNSKDSSDTDMMMTDINKIIYTTRETLYELRPNVLYDLGLRKGIEKLVDRFEDNNDFEEIHFNISRFVDPIDIDIQLNIYRIVQELLNNASKHSNAKVINLILVNIKEKIVIHYEDNGIGVDFDNTFKEKSMGLSGIKERVKLLNGSINIETGEGKGFKVIIEL